MPSEEMNVLRKAVRNIMDLLARGDYQAAVDACVESRLNADDIRLAVEGYGRRLVCPPGDVYADLDVVRVQGASEPTWSVRAPMWTAEEGRSDLTLELTFAQANDGVHLELDDLHVL